MFQWASNQFDKLSQTVAPPPTDAAGRFSYAITRLDENTAMGCIAEFDPLRTVVNQSKGWFPIHMACQYSMIRLIRLLMNQPGISIEQPDYAGCTPLHHACMSTQRSTGLDVVKTLVQEFGANPCAKNSDGKTPYDVATIDSIRQYLLPIQLQQETQYALDNGGQGLPPGIDLGGLKINRSNMAPPPQFGGMGVAAPPGGGSQSRYPQTPGMPSSSNTAPTAQQPGQPIIPASQPIARAPASVPGRSSSSSTPGRSQSAGGYSRSGGSSLAVYSKYKADGFHSSSSDVNLQRKYGHVGNTVGADVPPPPSSGNAPSNTNDSYVTSGPNPFTGAGSLAGVSRYASYGQPLAPAPASVPIRGYGYPVATESVPKFFTPTATNTVTAAATASTPSQSTNGPTSPFMPPPPYSGKATVESTTVTASPVITTRDPSFNSFAASNADTVSNLFQSPPKASDTAEAATKMTDPAATTIVIDESKQQIDSVVSEGKETSSNDTSSNWIETVDPVSGKTYYFNSETNETSWENPNMTSQGQEITVNNTKDTDKDTNSDSDWTEVVDPASGNSYYYNAKTHETSWEKPSSTVVDDNDSEDEKTDKVKNDNTEWVETTDPSSGNTYYYNTITGDTTWEHPESLDSEQRSTPPDGLASPETVEKLPETANGIAPIIDITEEKGDDKKDENGSSSSADSPKTKPIKEESDSVAVTVAVEQQSEIVENESFTAVEPKNPEGETAIPSESNTTQDSSVLEMETNTRTETGESSLNALLDGWAETTDPSSGKTYYFNADTKETRWDRPIVESPPKDSSKDLTTEETETSIGLEEKQSEAIEEEKKTNTDEKIPSESDTTQDNSVLETETNTRTETSESSLNALLDGWAETTDPSSGKTYYFNAGTQETRWDRPVADGGSSDDRETKKAEDRGNNTTDSDNITKSESEAAEGGDLADGWEEVQDQNTGRHYYYNKETQETSWEKPKSESSDLGKEGSAQPSEGGNDWVETVDPSSGNTYFYNATTGETSWERRSTKTTDVQTSNIVTSECKPTSTDDTFAQPAVNIVTKLEEMAIDKPQSSHLAGGHERVQNAEEMFSSPPEVGKSNRVPGSFEVDKPDFVPPVAAIQRSTVSTTGVSTPGSVATTAEDLFGKSSTEAIPGKPPESITAEDLFGAKTAASEAALIEPKTAEDLFGANVAVSASATTPELSECKTAEDLFGANTTAPNSTNLSEPKAVEDSFGAHAVVADSVKNSESMGLAPEPLPLEVVENSNEDGEGDMTDIPLTPATETIVKPAENLPSVPNTTDPAPSPMREDLFAAIGMPPPPFQSKR